MGYKGPAGSYAGTSIASAYVSRALALYFTQHPNATTAEAISALKAAATDAGAAGQDPGRFRRGGRRSRGTFAWEIEPEGLR